MSAISSVSQVTRAYTEQTQKSTPPSKPAQHQSGKDTVQLSKTARAALSGGDADHDGDSH
jgi:hypothetical protein